MYVFDSIAESRRYKELQAENIKLRLQDIPFIEGNLKGYRDRVEELKARNKELEEENKTLKGFTSSIFNENIEKEYVPKAKVKEDLRKVEEVYEREMKPYQRDYGLDVSLLNRKEKAELINKRNCLIVQMETYKQLLES